MHGDFRDIVAELVASGARFLIVGAHALGVHGVPRATADLDLWIDPSPENVELVWRALAAFGAPLAWHDRIEESFFDVRAPFIGREAFVRNKKASARMKALADLESLGEP